jgi:hypothetical protein
LAVLMDLRKNGFACNSVSNWLMPSDKSLRQKKKGSDLYVLIDLSENRLAVNSVWNSAVLLTESLASQKCSVPGHQHLGPSYNSYGEHEKFSDGV